MGKRLVVSLLFPFVSMYIVVVMSLTCIGFLSGYFYIIYGDADKRMEYHMSNAFKLYELIFEWAANKHE